MTATKHFGDVSWDSGQQMMGWNPGRGWVMPSDRGSYITIDDPYWGRVLDNARKSYGDPGIHFDTDDQGQVRHLVFGDGSKLPADGTVVYHDAARHQNWAQNDDGTSSLIGPDGKPGPALPPAGYHKFGDQYAPVNATGQQIGPQQGGLPPSNGGFYTDPKTGVLTPKNNNGDYYTLSPDGKKAFFDRTGAPITEQQYNDATAGRPPGDPDTAGLPTDQQQSGDAADAVRKLQEELKARFTTISSAEEKLSEVLLNAHATNAAGQAKLNDIQINVSLASCTNAAAPVNQDPLGAAVRYAVVEKDAVIVAAAGNKNDPMQPDCGQNPAFNALNVNDPRDWDGVRTIVSPAYFSDYVLSVAAVTPEGVPMPDSINGPWVGVAAPGSRIMGLSSTNGAAVNASLAKDPGTGNGIWGTSFSAAYVSGVAALVRAKYPNLTAHQVIRRIMETAHNPAHIVDNQVGYGVVDPVAALTFDVAAGDPKPVEHLSTALHVPPPPPAPDTRARSVALLGAGAAVVLAAVLGGIAAIRRRMS